MATKGMKQVGTITSNWQKEGLTSESHLQCVQMCSAPLCSCFKRIAKSTLLTQALRGLVEQLILRGWGG